MVVAIAELGDVLTKVTNGDFVVLANQPTLQEAPETFDRVGVDFALCVTDLMVNGVVWHERFDVVVPTIFVSHEHGVCDIDVFPDEFIEALGLELGLVYGLGDDTATTLHDADYGSLIGAASGLAVTATLGEVALTNLAWPDIGFVHFADAA